MKRVLHIAKDLSLPLDAVTQTIAIVAKRRAGKSYTMRRLVEQLFKAGQQIVLVDPKGDQHGIRSSADGKGPGLAVVILGGERGDVPLEPGSGEVVAKLVVVERVSVVLDLSLFRKHEVATFMTGFMENLYRLKAKEAYRTPMMLVIDEADAIAPQKPQKGEERMLGAAEDIVRRGGQRGIGCVLVTQRSAVLNKNVLTQAQILVVLRTIAPQDLLAMKAWIDVHGTEDEGADMMDSLPSLPVGDAWFWSPGWPTVDGIFKRVHVLPIETFDSGATPKPGEKRAEPKSAADVDLEALKRQMAATIEKAKADDPKALRAENAKLRADLAKAVANHTADLKADPLAVAAARQEGREEGGRDGYAAGLRAVQPLAERLSTLSAAVSDQIEAFRADLKRLVGHTPAPKAAPQAPGRNLETPLRPSGTGQPAAPADGFTAPEQRVLDALAWWRAIGVERPDKGQVGFMAGYRVSKNVGGTFGNLLGALRARGFIEYPAQGLAMLTDAGLASARPPSSEPTTADLHRAIFDRLDGPEQRVLMVLIDCYPEALTKQECGARADYTVGGNVGGTFGNILGRLRSLGLIDYPSMGRVVALPVLFLEGR